MLSIQRETKPLHAGKRNCCFTVDTSTYKFNHFHFTTRNTENKKDDVSILNCPTVILVLELVCYFCPFQVRNVTNAYTTGKTVVIS